MRAWAVKDMVNDSIIFATLRLTKGSTVSEAQSLNISRSSKRYKAVPVEIREVTDEDEAK